ncbi:MAG: biotin/lipoyl-binding protein, partial [Poseidonibacter sp.]|uniref:biotin/lipoyl-binding protein n=1 Tax=Poseidonibacter sp. TaxID=2321188 RepID=UPI00359EDDA0
MNNKKYNYTQEDYEFMNSLSSAVLERSPKKLRIVLWFWIITVALLITWAYYAQIDEIVRGEGKVVPVGENKMIQNLEGGIVQSILVKDGDIVKKGQILLKIENQKSQSDYESMNLKSLELMAKVIRLSSEANDKPFLVSKFKDNDVSTYIPLEQNLYEINKLKLNSEIDGLQEQLKQKENDYLTAKSNINYLSREYNLIQEEVRIAAPLVAKKVRSKVDFLKLKREANNIRKELALVRMSIPKTQSLIEEAKNK